MRKIKSGFHLCRNKVQAKKNSKEQMQTYLVVYNPNPQIQITAETCFLRPTQWLFFLRLSTFSCTRLTRIVCNSPSIEPFFCVGHVFLSSRRRRSQVLEVLKVLKSLHWGDAIIRYLMYQVQEVEYTEASLERQLRWY